MISMVRGKVFEERLKLSRKIERLLIEILELDTEE